MSLFTNGFWLLDLQTTGTSSSTDAVIEVAWTRPLRPEDLNDTPSQNWDGWTRSAIVQPPLEILEDSRKLRRTQRICGITPDELQEGVQAPDVWKHILEDLKGRELPCLIHYATFEKAFLPQLCGSEPLPFPIVCTHKISRRVFPELPSKSLRAVSGRLGHFVGEMKRGSHHITASLHVVKAILKELNEREVHSLEKLDHFLKTKAAASPPPHTGFSSLVRRDTRLSLPKLPGVYRFSGPNNQTLYIGKATCLKTRVNSYFRGRKTKGSRLHEMLSQAHNVSVMTTRHPLEAALVEVALIKKLDPPYNRALRQSDREVGFLHLDTKLQTWEVQDEIEAAQTPFCETFGPFSSLRSLQEACSLLTACFLTHRIHTPLEKTELRFSEECLKQTRADLLEEWGFSETEFQNHTLRALVGQARKLLLSRLRERALEKEQPQEMNPDDDEEGEPEESLTEETVLDVEDSDNPALCRAFVLSALRSLLSQAIRARKLNRMLNATITLAPHLLIEVKNGQLQTGQELPTDDPLLASWNEPSRREPECRKALSLKNYDQCSVLYSELLRLENKNQHFEIQTPQWKSIHIGRFLHTAGF